MPLPLNLNPTLAQHKQQKDVSPPEHMHTHTPRRPSGDYVRRRQGIVRSEWAEGMCARPVGVNRATAHAKRRREQRGRKADYGQVFGITSCSDAMQRSTNAGGNFPMR